MKRFHPILLMLTLLPACVGFAAHAHRAAAPSACIDVAEAEISVYFAPSSTEINPGLESNRQAFRSLDSLLTMVSNDSSWVVKILKITGSASPEGSASLNRKLSLKRAGAIARYFATYTDSDSVPTVYDYIGADWNGLRELVATTGNVPDRDKVLQIIDSGRRDRLSQLRRLSGGSTYRWLLHTLFPQLRVSDVVVTLRREEAPVTIMERPHAEIAAEAEPQVPDTVAAPVTAPEPEPQPMAAPEVAPEPQPAPQVSATEPLPLKRWYIKTNAVAWAMGITNIAVEFDVAPHLSVTFPIYYSAWEYFSHKVKFRTFALQPEVRWWLRPDNMGLFGGVHFGVAQYNMAIGGKYRFQDHDGRNPALGGGISVGYRRLLGKSGRWMMELTAGAGVYGLHYDAFDNSSVPGGQFVYDRYKTFFGVDNVGVTFIYSLPLKTKGGRQ